MFSLEGELLVGGHSKAILEWTSPSLKNQQAYKPLPTWLPFKNGLYPKPLKCPTRFVPSWNGLGVVSNPRDYNTAFVTRTNHIIVIPKGGNRQICCALVFVGSLNQ